MKPSQDSRFKCVTVNTFFDFRNRLQEICERTPDSGPHFVDNLDFSLSFWTLASKVLDFH